VAVELLGLLGSVAFSLASAVVGVRLLLLARRTRGAPELAMGLAFVSSGALGFACFVVADLMRKSGSTSALVSLLGIGATLFFFAGYLGLAVGCWRMFRPRERWPLGLIGADAAILLAASAVIIAGGNALLGWAETATWVGISVGASVFAWSSIESYVLHAQMARRLKVGLVEPEVVDRVRLWGVGSLAAFAMTAHAIALRVITGVPDQTDGQRLASSLFGLVAAVAIFLAFFPPAFYRRRFLVKTA
jgi:hypothetical protein